MIILPSISYGHVFHLVHAAWKRKFSTFFGKLPFCSHGHTASQRQQKFCWSRIFSIFEQHKSGSLSYILALWMKFQTYQLLGTIKVQRLKWPTFKYNLPRNSIHYRVLWQLFWNDLNLQNQSWLSFSPVPLLCNVYLNHDYKRKGKWKRWYDSALM